VGLSSESEEVNRALMDHLGLRFDVLGEPAGRLLERLGFWTRTARHPAPGLLFLDGCGDVAHRLFGRWPGGDQTDLVLQLLRKLAERGRRCDTA